MAATRAGGLKTAKLVRKKFGNDFHKRIGAKGGATSKKTGFYKNSEAARKAGELGGKLSRRGMWKLSQKEHERIKQEHRIAQDL